MNYSICRLGIASTDFSKNSYSYSNEKGLSGYINYHGELVIPCNYQEAWPFKNGIAICLPWRSNVIGSLFTASS